MSLPGQVTPKYGTAFPAYCPDDLREDVPCWACGAEAAVMAHYCRARHNGPRPRNLVDIVLIDKRTDEIVASTGRREPS